MKKRLFLFVVVCFILAISCLHAELQFSIADTLEFGGMTFGSTVQLNETHYVSITGYSVSLYQVQSGIVSLIDKELSPNYLGWNHMAQLVGNRLYVLSFLQDVYVFEVTDTALSLVGEIALHNIPGRDSQNVFMKLFGSRMVIGRQYRANQYASPDNCIYDVYELNDTFNPVFLASFNLPGYSNTLLNVHFIGGIYYLITASGEVYATEDLSQLQFVNVLPSLPDDEVVENSLVWDETLYLLTSSSFGSSLVKCSELAGNFLGVAWMMPSPLMVCFDIRVETDRVLFWGLSSEMEFKLFSYLPGDILWTLQFQRDFFSLGIHEVEAGYLDLSLTSVNLYDNNFNQAQVLYHGEEYSFQALLARRYAIIWNSSLYKIYDIQARTWLNYSSSYNRYIPSRSVNENQIMFRSNTACELLTFDSSGSYQLSSFSLPFNPNDIDFWGNRLLATCCVGINKEIHVYELNGNILTEIANHITQVANGETCFYDADHLVDKGMSYSADSIVLDFYRINNPGLDLLLQQTLPDYAGHLYISSDKITLGSLNSPIFDISNPDVPVQSSLFSLPITGYPYTSYDGQDRYLIGPDNNSRYYITHADFSHFTSFKADNAVYCGRNTMLVKELNLLIILQHTEPVENTDPSLPPIEAALGSVYPNPFRDNLSLELQLKEPMHTIVEVYNLKGQKVKELFCGKASKGQLQLNWDARDSKGKPVASGIYLFKITAGRQQKTLKAIHLR